jgi:tetratricopeptide (TPR) repeat protein
VHNWNSYLSVVAVSVVLAAVILMGSRSRTESWGSEQTWRYPPALGYLLLGGGLLALIFPFLDSQGTPPARVTVLWLAGGAALAAAVYFLRYRVTVGLSTLEFGAWNPVSIPISDIVDTDMVVGRAQLLILYLRDGRRLAFSGRLENFSSLAATLTQRVAPAAPTARKLEDQRRRARLGLGTAAGTGTGTATGTGPAPGKVRRFNWVVALLFVLIPLVFRLMTGLQHGAGPLSGTVRGWVCAVPALAQRVGCFAPVSADPERARLASQALLATQRLDLPATDEITGLITAHRFDEFEERSRRYESGFARDPAYESPLQKLYDAICATDPAVPAALDEWVRSKPSYTSYAARGIYEMNLGYRQRGANYRRDTPPENFRRMDQSFKRARADLTAALELNPKFVPAYTALILIAQADGEHLEAQRIERQATRAVPSTYYVRHAYIMTLRPEWGGSYQAMHEYAATLDAAARLNPRIWTLQGDEWSQRGKRAWQEGDQREALEDYSNALRYGDRLEFLENRGFLYVNTRQYELALRDFDRYREYSRGNQRINDYTQCIQDYQAGRGCHLKKPANSAAQSTQT